MITTTNRSGKDVDATLSLRDKDGNPVTDNIVKVDGTYYSAANATITIPAYGQKVFSLTDVTQTSTIRGGGTLSWKFTDESEGDCCKPLAVVVEKSQFYRYSNYDHIKKMGMYQVMVNGDTWF